MIPLYLLNQNGATIVQIDDPATDTDLGSSYGARLVTIQFTESIWGMLRTLIQEVFVTASATLKVTPVADGSEAGTDAQSFSLIPGVNTITTFMNKFGTRFQLAIEITAHVGITELGDFWRKIVPRRSYR
jgi:hypothetical protein